MQTDTYEYMIPTYEYMIPTYEYMIPTYEYMIPTSVPLLGEREELDGVVETLVSKVLFSVRVQDNLISEENLLKEIYPSLQFIKRTNDA